MAWPRAVENPLVFRSFEGVKLFTEDLLAVEKDGAL